MHEVELPGDARTPETAPRLVQGVARGDGMTGSRYEAGVGELVGRVAGDHRPDVDPGVREGSEQSANVGADPARRALEELFRDQPHHRSRHAALTMRQPGAASRMA